MEICGNPIENPSVKVTVTYGNYVEDEWIQFYEDCGNVVVVGIDDIVGGECRPSNAADLSKLCFSTCVY